MSEGYVQCKHPRGVMSISKGKPKPTKVLSTSSPKFAKPSTQKVFSSQGGNKK